MIVDSVMTDHPSWSSRQGGGFVRAVRSGGSAWVLTAELTADGRYELSATGRDNVFDASPELTVVDPAGLAGTDPIVHELRRVGRVGRWRNPDMWDAVATAIVRQVIRAGQARKLYRLFSRAHGDRVITPDGPEALFPSPDVVLDLPDEEYQRLGLAFKRRPLQAAAEAVLEFGDKWAELPPADLAVEVQTVPRIGPWTAGAAVADLTNDYAIYPFADLAVRTWAATLAPGRAWPDTEPEFAREWLRLAHHQLSDRTLLTLAWGVRHAHSAGGTAL